MDNKVLETVRWQGEGHKIAETRTSKESPDKLAEAGMTLKSILHHDLKCHIVKRLNWSILILVYSTNLGYEFVNTVISIMEMMMMADDASV